MRKLSLILLAVIPLIPVSTAYAESSASSYVENHVNATSNSNSGNSATTHTSITTETNGKVTHYESDEPNQNISVESVDGESTIKVNGEKVTGQPTGSITKNPSPSPSPHPTLSNEKKEEVKQNLGKIEEALETIKEKINSLEQKLSSLFG